MRLTKRQAAIIGAYTGVTCGPFADIHEYAEELLGDGIQTITFAGREFAALLKEKAKADFISICHKEEV